MHVSQRIVNMQKDCILYAVSFRVLFFLNIIFNNSEIMGTVIHKYNKMTTAALQHEKNCRLH